MPVQWVTDEGEMHHAEWPLSVRGKVVVLYMQVESLGESGWDWNMWELSGCVRQRYGLADTLDKAKAKVEGALGDLAWELILAT
jgi:hypothetical protein